MFVFWGTEGILIQIFDDFSVFVTQPLPDVPAFEVEFGLALQQAVDEDSFDDVAVGVGQSPFAVEEVVFERAGVAAAAAVGQRRFGTLALAAT